MRWFWVLLTLTLVGGGLYYSLRDDPLRSELNRRFPPVDVEQQRQKAVDSASTAVSILTAPNVAAGTDVATIQRVLQNELSKRGVTKLALDAERQLLRLTADFDIKLKPEDLPPGLDKADLLSKLKPQVAGRIDVFLGAAAELTSSTERTLRVKLLPAVRGLEIQKLTVAGRYDMTEAGDLLAAVLNRYADNLSAAIGGDPVLNIELPTTLQKEFDVSGPIHVDLKEAPDLKLTLAAHSVKSPFGLAAAAWLIDHGKIEAVFQLAPLGDLPPKPPEKVGTFDEVKTVIRKSTNDALGIADPPPGIWLAIGKALIAKSLDHAFSEAQPCLTGEGSIPREEFSQKVPTPDASSIDCTPRKDCTPTRQCDLQEDTRDCRRPRNCTHNHDERECNKCIASAFGHCITHGNDPFCEAAKAAQNAAYDTDFNACNALGPIMDAVCEAEKATQNGLYSTAKLKCEADKKAESVACEAAKTSEKFACEGEKGVIDGLHRTGNLANIDGSVAGNGNLRICFRNVHFGENMDKVSLALEADGKADIDTHFKFVPLDVAGHVLCPLEWTADKRITASIPLQSVATAMSLVRKDASSDLSYEGKLDGLALKLHFQPSPLSLVLQNVNFALACPPAAGLINGLTLGLGPLLPEFLKDFTYKTKPVSFSFSPTLPTQTVLGQKIKPVLSENSAAFVLTGNP
jgi:hypothetical protein